MNTKWSVLFQFRLCVPRNRENKIVWLCSFGRRCVRKLFSLAYNTQSKYCCVFTLVAAYHFLLFYSIPHCFHYANQCTLCPCMRQFLAFDCVCVLCISFNHKWTLLVQMYELNRLTIDGVCSFRCKSIQRILTSTLLNRFIWMIA